MPIASGAAGRVDVGVDASKTWTPDGLKKKTKPVNRNCDSYLQRWVRLLHCLSVLRQVFLPVQEEHFNKVNRNLVLSCCF